MNSRLFVATACLVLLAAPGDAQDPVAAASAAGPAPAVKSVVANTGDVRRTLTRKGTFVPAEGVEHKVELEAYQSRGLEIVSVVPHGSFVNEGDVLVRFDKEDYDRKLVEAKMAYKAAELSHKHGEERRRMAAAQAVEGLAKAEVEAARAAKRLEGYKKYDKPIQDESQRIAKASRGYRIDDQRDELEQLEKMYGEDELVDATEEIVLKRSRRNFARTVASNELTERRIAYNKQYYDSWKLEDYERAAQRAEASLERTRRSVAMSREKAAVDAAQAQYRLRRQREKLADLEKDGEQFVVRASRRGIVLHGRLKGPWMARHKKEGKVAPGSVFLSVADARKYDVKTDIAEGDLLKLKPNTAAEITPTVASDKKLAGRLEVAYLPGKPGVFPAKVPLGAAEVRLRPGLTCKVEVILAEERGVVLVPLGAVKRAAGKATVRVSDDGKSFQEVEVVTGTDDGRFIAIRDGVKAGQRVAVGQ